MGRRKKSEIEAEPSPQSDLIVCPVCGKEFRPTEETYCWVQEGLYEYKQVCSWACFKKRVNELSAKLSENKKKKTIKKDTVKVDLSKIKKTNGNKEDTKEDKNKDA